ncbi:MAG: T9SS type A sorting domain-containing protein [Saprospiraceae bacterium]|nr:T9SS type A sorting domain-containing protein [Saprospiraceae bacterium]
MKFFSVLFIVFFLVPLKAQIVINEVSSTNNNVLKDEDGSCPDWIELYNAGSTSIDLENWSLSDSKNIGKWIFPKIILGPKNYSIIFASGKNRRVVDNSSNIHHWETVIMDDDEWAYFVGDKEPPIDWNTLDFNTVSWNKGKGGFGYGDNDDGTVLPASTLSVYYRKNFTIVQADKILSAILNMDYDDSFIAYINGVEVARNNITGSVVPYNGKPITDHEAAMYTGGKPESFELQPELIKSLVKDGNNVIAVQVNNIDASSSDLTARTWLQFGLATPERLYRPNPVWFDPPKSFARNLHTNFKLTKFETLSLYNSTETKIDSVRLDEKFQHSKSRIPDGGNWCFSELPSPLSSNGIMCFSSYSAKPSLSESSGFYNSSLKIMISGVNCKFTTDGSDPALTSESYVNPISITKTTVLKVRSFESGKLPSSTIVATYFINQTSELPVISISSAHRNLFSDGTNGPAVYDKARGFTQSEKTFCHVEYFNKDKNLLFQDNASLTPVGNYSLDFGQKSLQFVFDEDWGANNEEIPNIFILDKPHLKSLHGFRIRNMDDDASSTRIRDVIANRMGVMSHAGAGAYQHVAVYINGRYWGHYGAREILDKYFMRDNYGADPDSVNLVKTAYSIKPDYFPEEGTADSFLEMSNFIISSDLTIEDNYKKALDRIDFENWVDYYANQIYNNNQDWYPSQYFNNTRLAECVDPHIKWKYMLWDMTVSQGNYASAYDDLLTNCLDNPQVPNKYSAMMKSLLRNPGFKNYFINRFADLLNETWKTSNLNRMIDESANELASEIQPNSARWGSVDSVSWRANINGLKDFHRIRPAIQRNHIQNYFKLNKQVEISVDVFPKGAGVIKISTLIPENLPWKGIYFHGNPVTITAIANPGYRFTHWSSNTEISDTLFNLLELDVRNNALFKANFSGTPLAGEIEFSEVNYNSDSTVSSGDWIELHNLTNVDLDISNYTIVDDQISNQYKFPVSTILKKNDYLVLCSDVTKFKLRNPAVINFIGPIGFDLNNRGEKIQLTDRSGNQVVSMSYVDSLDWPCTADGYGRTLELKTERANPNLSESWFDGCMGGSPGTSFKPCMHGLLISEINYKSLPAKDAGDWIELFNNSIITQNVSNYKISDLGSNSYTIPNNTFLNPNQYIVIAQDLVKFRSQFPKVQNVIGSTQFGFDGNGDIIRLYKSNGELLFSICYDDTAPFPKGADGGGYTLELKDYNGNVNDGNNWFDGCPGGSPGTKYDPTCGSSGVVNNFESDLKIFPNPASSQLNIQLKNPKDYISLKIINFLGHEIQSYEITNMEQELIIPLNSIPDGIYTLSFYSNTGQTVSKLLVIQK